MPEIHRLLQELTERARTRLEKGKAFERLIREFLSQDKTYSPQFTDVQSYADWAKQRGLEIKDIGIDLVAKNAEDEFYTAIQCKFYDLQSSIDKKGIDSFIAASDREEFSRRIFVDTTEKGITDNLLEQIQKSKTAFNRISISELENSSIDWNKYLLDQQVTQKPQKTLRPHQQEALRAVQKGLKKQDRGKLLMACGTGKTFTALKIAEKLAGKNSSVLFLAPSLALLSQTITEWTIESQVELRSFAVCSDTQVGRRKAHQEDIAEINTMDLAYPATTNPQILADKYSHKSKGKMQVIFATYQSIEVISQAQQDYHLPEFDLIICDEAHRTTGASLAGEDESHFVKVHNQDFIQGTKRLYMTATPRVFIDSVKQKAQQKEANLYSMDNEHRFGKDLFVLSFGDAVMRGLLSDYKVTVLAVDEGTIAQDIQSGMPKEDNDSNLKLNDVAKMVGCYKALLKIGIENTEGSQPMRRAVAFTRTIQNSKQFRDQFGFYIDKYKETQTEFEQTQLLDCQIKHLDGTMNTAERNAGISWLKQEHDDQVCRILSNARCLSEGVDVPSLDAVVFVHSRKSKVDIVQSVGRVMRKAEGKKLGYIILPLAVPPGVSPDKMLDDNKNFEVVWDVLNALRSHDERLDAEINKIEFGGLTNRIEIVSEITELPAKSQPEGGKGGSGGGNGGTGSGGTGGSSDRGTQLGLNYQYDSFQKAVLAKIVQKCGTRTYWENWAGDVAEIAQKHITRINGLLEHTQSEEYKAFSGFLQQLQNNINTSITKEEVVEMLAQHMITKPVFEALFSNYDFNAHNPVSQAIEKVLDVLDKHNIDKEAEKLEKFYASIKRRVAGIDNELGKQKIIVELYDKFFRGAFPKLTERLGIVYTPVECVDFIIKSVNDILQQEFNQTLADENTHIIDPFTGTGTFITRLLQSGIIPQDKLEYKFKNELHANEIVLLAYYIATINIESSFHQLINQGKKDQEKQGYQAFEGICLTDTFQLYENRQKELITPLLPVNSERLNKQKKQDIKVIIGNPPYSIGQSSGNDNNQNLAYPQLDASIEKNYVVHSKAGLSKGLYDSYIRAIRWASDRLGEAGVIGFITNAGWLESNSADGMRKALREEFSSIYIFHLRGNQRTSGELSRKEGGKIFGGGSRAPIAISILVKNPQAQSQGNIYFHDIGDYLSREQKLRAITELSSIAGITNQNLWQSIQADKYNDWLNQRDDSFYTHIKLGTKDKNDSSLKIFANYSLGLATNRDAWAYNASKSKLEQNIKNTIAFYNAELERYNKSGARKRQPSKKAEAEKYIAKFVQNDSRKIAFSRDFRYDIFDNTRKSFREKLIECQYRPFQKTNCYYDGSILMHLSQMPKIFPEAGLENVVIGVSGKGATSFSCFISNAVVDLNSLQAGAQCFPLKLYEPIADTNGQRCCVPETEETITAASGQKYRVMDGITDEGLKHFVDFYKQEIAKEDIFYYIYGLLHSEDYTNRFADNLTKDLPHIPRVKKYADFQKFTEAGRKLADLHLNYENQDPYPAGYEQGAMAIKMLEDRDFYVEKMRFRNKEDKTVIIYNDKITLTNIPLEAYDYVVNNRSAIEWVMERQQISTHKDSGITNNPNDWARETMNNPRYPLDLLLKVITISLESVGIIRGLPKLLF